MTPTLGAWRKEAPFVASTARQERPAPSLFPEQAAQIIERLGAGVLRASSVRVTERDRSTPERKPDEAAALAANLATSLPTHAPILSAASGSGNKVEVNS